MIRRRDGERNISSEVRELAAKKSRYRSISVSYTHLFHDCEIVGWFLTRPGKSLGVNEKITKIHVDQFPGREKTLFLMDPLDCLLYTSESAESRV